MIPGVAAAYSAVGPAWAAGPSRVVYDRLADLLAERCPAPLAGALVLDLGAGTGAASRAARRRGADVVAVDVAAGMLAIDAAGRPPAAVGDAQALPFSGRTFGAVLAAFSLNHVPAPQGALREARRVLRPGGALVASVPATDDEHPVKVAVEAAAADRGWREEAWYTALRNDAAPRLATVERAARCAEEAGLAGAVVENLRVPLPGLGPHDLVAWRLGLAQLASFVHGLSTVEQAALAADAVARLGPDPPVLVRSLILLSWRAPS